MPQLCEDELVNRETENWTELYKYKNPIRAPGGLWRLSIELLGFSSGHGLRVLGWSPTESPALGSQACGGGSA